MHDINIYNILMIVSFTIGYFLITIEHFTHINKTAIALLMAVVCWIFQFVQYESKENNLIFLSENLSQISQVVFFLLCALTIVEIINVHKGFNMISNAIRMRSKKMLLWIIGIITFFLSAVLDNLTTTIVMLSLLRKLMPKGEERLLLGGAIVVAANAGGVWTPIGDVTTTMLWIGGQLSTQKMMTSLFIPSIICLFISFLYLSWFLKGNVASTSEQKESKDSEPMGVQIFWLGIGCLIFVPIFKVSTGLPPFMGILFGLGFMWLFTDIVHSRYEERFHLRVPHIMSRVDVSSVLFFLGILLAIEGLHTAGLLHILANWMDRNIVNLDLIAVAIGLSSAIIDNVPLVAASMGMYDLQMYPTDSGFWALIAYCAGTGGSILVIGSAAGVAFMGLERVDFFWYARRVGFSALLGYFAGIGAFKLLES